MVHVYIPIVIVLTTLAFYDFDRRWGSIFFTISTSIKNNSGIYPKLCITNNSRDENVLKQLKAIPSLAKNLIRHKEEGKFKAFEQIQFIVQKCD